MSNTYYIDYGVLAGDHVDANSGVSSSLGNVGSLNAITGSGTIIATNQTYTGPDLDNTLSNAQADYAYMITLTPDSSSGATEIGGTTYMPGTYEFTDTNVTFGTGSGNNIITLDGVGTYFFLFPNGDFSTDSTLANVSINLLNGAKSTELYWIVSGNVNLQSQSGNKTTFWGLILCNGNVTLGTNSTNLGSIVAPNVTGVITVNSNNFTATSVQIPRDVSSHNYVNVESTLADNESVSIIASNTFGGIKVEAGFGGIAVDTTNSISLDANAVSNFTTTLGNLELQAIVGLVNIDGGSGINIGNDPSSTPVNIGTSSNSKLITLGNSTGTTQVDINTGTGGLHANTATGGNISLNANGASSNFTLASTANSQDLTLALTGSNASRIVLSSAGTGSDSIFLNTSTGGLTSSIGGQINFVSSSASGAAFNVDTTANSGGISLTSGNQGVVINALWGTIGLGNFVASAILLGTVGPNTITIGNTATNTRLFERFGADGHIKHQEPETALSDADATLTIAQLLLTLFTITPTVDRTLTLPTAALVVAGISGVSVNDSIDFVIINNSTSANNATSIISAGSGGSIQGNANVNAKSDNTFYTSGSGTFRLRLTNVTASTEAYVAYRIA